MVSPTLPLPQPNVPLFGTEGKPTQAGYEFLDRLQAVVKQINATVAALSFAPTGAQYVTLANDATLNAERVLTAGTGISLTDSGANGTITVDNTQVVGGLTLLSSASVGTGTTYSVTGLGGYKMLMCVLVGVSHNNVAVQQFRVALSGNNGSTYGTALVPQTTTFANTAAIYGVIFIDRVDQTNNQAAVISTWADLSAAPPVDASSRGPINALQFSWAAGNFDAGTIDIYGLK
jgi:hypothetical protein